MVPPKNTQLFLASHNRNSTESLLGSARLLRQQLAGTTHLLREVALFGQSIRHAQNGFLIVDVHRWCEGELRQQRRIHVDQAPRWMFGQHMATACAAPFTLTLR